MLWCMSQRDLYVDRLRVLMTALVILLHCSITYGASGGWFRYERHFDGSLPSILLTMFAGSLQAWFMGFFFLLAGYFTPASLERKGAGSFLRDRFRRLGWPLVFFILLLGPLTAAMNEAANGGSFWGTIRWLWQHHRIINGPLWFAQALLIFSLIYCAWCVLSRRQAKVNNTPRPIPGFFWWILSAFVVGAVALAIRQVVPTGVNVFGLQLGFFSSYIFLFFLGIAAYRNNWLHRLTWRQAWLPGVISLLTWPELWILSLHLHATHPHEHLDFSGGTSLPAIVYAFWEPFFAWGVIAALLLIFRQWLNRPSALWEWLCRRAYAVYVIHPPVLVGMSILFFPWAASPLIKFAVVGVLSCITTWLLSDPLVRLPGLRRVL